MLCLQGLHPGSKQHSAPGPCGPPALQANSQGQAPGDEGTKEVEESRPALGRLQSRVSSLEGQGSRAHRLQMHLEASFFKSARIGISLYLTIFWDSCFSAWLSSSTLTSAHSNTPTTTTMSPSSLLFCVPPPSAIWGFGIHE